MAQADSSESEFLVAQLRQAADRSRGERVTVAHLVDSLGPSSFALVCLVLTVPFLQPVSVGPLATAGGFTFAMLGWQIFRGEAALRLPARVRTLAPGPRGWSSISRVLERLLGLGRRLSRPRLTHWTEGTRGDRWVGALIALGGLLMAIPFVAVPLNNTFPALVIASAALARLHRDGIMLVVAAVWLKITLAYFAVILWALFFLGDRGFEWFRG